MVDDAGGTFRDADGHHFLDDCENGIRVGPDGAGAGITTEGAEPAPDHLGMFPGLKGDGAAHGDELVVADDHFAVVGKIHGNHGDFLEVDVLPDIQFGPVGQGEDADRLPLVDTGVVQVPQFGALVAGIPLAELVAEGEDPFLGAGPFLLAAGAAERRIVLAGLDGVEQGAGLEDGAAFLGAVFERVHLA